MRRQLVLATLFGLHEHDYLTPTGLIQAGCRVITRTAEALPEGSVVPARVVARLSECRLRSGRLPPAPTGVTAAAIGRGRPPLQAASL